MRLGRLLVRLLWGAVFAACAAVAGVIVLAHTEAGRDVLRPRLERTLADALDAHVTIGAFETPRLGTVAIGDLSISFGGQSWLRAVRVEIHYALPGLRSLAFPHVAIDGLAGRLVWREGRLGPRTRPPRDDDGGGGIGVHVGRLDISAGRLGIEIADDREPFRMALADLGLEAALDIGPEVRRIDVAMLRAVPRGVPQGALAVTGRIEHTDGGPLLVDEARIALGATRLEGRLSAGAAHGLDADARATAIARDALAVLAPGFAVPPGATAHVTAHGPWNDLRVRATAELAEAGRLAARGRLDATAEPPAYRAALVATGVTPSALDPAWPDEPLDGSARARGRGTRHVAHGRLTAAGTARIDWRGWLTTGPALRYAATARGEVHDLRRLAGAVEGRFPFRVALAGSGGEDAPARTRIEVELGRGVVAATEVLGATSRWHLERRRLELRAARVTTAAGVVTGDGAFDLARHTIEAALHGSRPDGTGIRVAAAAARDGTRWRGRIDSLAVDGGVFGVWRSDAPGTFTVGEGFSLERLRLSSDAQQLVVAASLRNEAVSAVLEAERLQLAPWCTLARVPCTGALDGAVRVAGTTAAPRLAVEATAREIAVGRLQRVDLDARLRHERGRAAGEIRFTGAGGHALLEGSAPVPLPGVTPAADGTLDLRLTARRLNLGRLAVWWPNVVRDADGRIRADVRVGGTLAAPRPIGTATVRASRFTLVASGARWTDVLLELRADGGSVVTIERLTARGGDGTLAGEGTFDFGAGPVPEARVRLRADRFAAVERPFVDAACTGTLRIEGSLAAPLVRGRLEIPSATIRPAFMPAANAPSELDPTIEVVGLPEDPSADAPPAGMGDVTLGVTIALGDDVRVRRHDADIEIRGTLRVERTPPAPVTARGTIRVERGWYTFSGRRFRLRGGAIQFEGGPLESAKLAVEATHRAGDYDVTVAISGTLDDPVLLLSSDPPLDEADVLAVLVVGRPSGELSDSERLAVQAEAASLALGYAMPGVSGGGLAGALGLEEISLSPEALRVSRRIGHDVFISLSQQFVGWAGQTVGIEYEFNRRLSVELSTSTRGSGAIDFFWRRRY